MLCMQWIAQISNVVVILMQKLSSDAAKNGLCPVLVVGDGNCAFRSVAHFVGDGYKEVRRKLVHELAEHPEEYRPFFVGDTDEWNDGLEALEVGGFWNGEICYQVV